MSNGPDTRKTLTLAVTLTFEGDYVPAEDCFRYAEGWISSGLEDRDDLVGVAVEQQGETVEETT